MEAKLTVRFSSWPLYYIMPFKINNSGGTKMKRFKIKRTKVISYKSYVKRRLCYFCCYEYTIKVSYFVNCSDKLSRRVNKILQRNKV